MPESRLSASRPRTLSAGATALLAASLAGATGCRPFDSARAGVCVTPPNEIVAENCLPGDAASEWDINGYGDPSIQGFGTDISIARGEMIRFKVDTDSDDYRIDIYRMGWYGGMGARRVDTVEPSASLPQIQPECLRGDVPVLTPDGGAETAEAPLFDCGNWAVSASWEAPADATSGIYFARLVREDPPADGWWKNDELEPSVLPPTGVDSLWEAPGYRAVMRNALREPRASHIYFVVRDDEGGSDLLFQTSDLTWQAYNRYGGHSVYGRLNPERLRLHGGPPRAYKVSYNRPFETRHYRAVNKVFNSEYPMVRWLERNGYDVSYTTGVDTDRRGEELLEHRVFLSVGHDEYWTGRQRRNVEGARDSGVHLAFFSSNEVYWKVRWEESIDGSGQPYRTLVTYKDSQDHRRLDPVEWTGEFRDHRPINPEGAWPENALTGTLFTVNAWRNDPLIADAGFARLRFWRNTEVARLRPGERYVSIKGILGHEWDSDIDNGHRPPGLFRLSAATFDNVLYCVHPGRECETGSATHSAVMYRHASGALVFGAGTLQWAWGLDAHHDTETGVPPERQNGADTRVGVDPHGPDRTLQQATLNLFADMGVQPATKQPELLAARPSADRVPPRSTIRSPADGSSVGGSTGAPGGATNPRAAAAVTITGTAFDTGGGVVAAVEVSTDGGATWHPATGRESWSYEWIPPEGGSTTILSRAVDDSGNLETPRAEVRVTTGSRLDDPGLRSVFDQGRRYTERFYRGDLAPLWGLMIGALAEEVQSLQGLRDFREEVAEVAGDEVTVLDEETFEDAGVRYYLRTASFEKLSGPAHVQWGFTEESRIVDFFIRPVESPEDVEYRTVTRLRLPFAGPWIVGSGGRTVEQNQHHQDYTNRFAYDFARAEDAGFRVGELHANEAFTSWGQAVVAPGDGTVVRVENEVADNAPGEMDRSVPMGNFVSIDHGNGEFSILGHLRQGSVRVRPGQRVAAGDPLGAIGNSGASTGPHLHYNLQSGPEPNRGTGLPAQFEGYCADGVAVARGEPVQGEVVEWPCPGPGPKDGG